MKYFYMLLILAAFITLSCKNEPPVCELKEIKTLFSIPGRSGEDDPTYLHYVLVKKFDRSCMDSATMVNMALSYFDTVSTGRPADFIKFFNSDKDFYPNEISQDQQLINKSCLVMIAFNWKTKKPERFIF